MENWDKQLANCKTNIDRAILARSSECEPILLKAFCYDELDPIVVEEAMINPNSEEDWVERACERFPELNTAELWEERYQRKLAEIEQIQNGLEQFHDDRDQIILKHIMKRDKIELDTSDHASQHLGKILKPSEVVFKNPDIEWAETSKYRVAMVMAPAWGVVFPPYNLAKLVGIIRKFGYSTKVFDLNIECYRSTLETLNEDFWRSEKYFLWSDKKNFYKYVLPYIKPLLQKAIDDIVAANPKVIGFSIYNTNLHATTYMVKEIKRRLPGACIVAGGPEISTSGQTNGALMMSPFNYMFVGEAEETFIDLLENLPKRYELSKFIGTTDSKLKLEEYPYADYSDYTLSNYKYDRGVSIETSRGCVAQCSFCAETYFWKFRSLTPERVIAEMEHQIKEYNIYRFWFVDSLVNGNLKNFERLVNLILEHNLVIKWNSYARCDGRMTSELIKKVADSGCTSLSFGIESGSQKVLHDMRKKVEIWEIENNFFDSAEYGLHTHANILIGFPTEEPLDFLHTMQITANLRKCINAVSCGFGAGPAQASHMQTDWKVYNMVGEHHVGDKTFLATWYTENYQNTILNRFLRIKMYHIWLEILETHGQSVMTNGQRFATIKDFYKFKAKKNKCKKYVKHDEFVKLDRLDPSEFKNNITNEYFAIIYGLYQYFGSYEFEMTCDPQVDLANFGNSLANDYTLSLKVVMSDNGDYTINIAHSLKHSSTDENKERILASERAEIDQSFDVNYTDTGNVSDWVSTENQTKETVHEQYRKKKKVITILPAA